MTRSRTSQYKSNQNSKPGKQK